MAPNFLPKQYIEHELESRKCSKCADFSTASKWMTRTGYFFTVPHQCDRQMFDQIMTELRRHFAAD